MLPPRPALSHLGGAHPSSQWQFPWLLQTLTETEQQSQTESLLAGKWIKTVKELLYYPSVGACGLGITVQSGQQCSCIYTLKVQARLKEKCFNLLMQSNWATISTVISRKKLHHICSWLDSLSVKSAYLSFTTGASRVNVGRIEHIWAEVEVCINTSWALNHLNTDLCTARDGAEVHVGTLHLSTLGVPAV